MVRHSCYATIPIPTLLHARVVEAIQRSTKPGTNAKVRERGAATVVDKHERQLLGGLGPKPFGQATCSAGSWVDQGWVARCFDNHLNN